MYTSLCDFTGGDDGGGPIRNVVFDANGNLYGTASEGGTGYRVVWEITPYPKIEDSLRAGIQGWVPAF